MSNEDNRIYLAKLITKKEIAKDTHEYSFELEGDMAYSPGQYVWIVLPSLSDREGVYDRRAFSIASAPNGSRQISVIFRTSQSEYNQNLRGLQIGDELKVIGPFGMSFSLSAKEDTQILLLAGGTGVTPFLSILRNLGLRKEERSVTLFYFEKNPEHVFYKEELESIARENHNIKFYFFDNEVTFDSFKTVEHLDKSEVWISGPQGFVNYYYELLRQNGIFEHQFKFENYYPDTRLAKKIQNIFVDGEIKIEEAEPNHIKQRAKLMYSLVNTTASHMVITDIMVK